MLKRSNQAPKAKSRYALAMHALPFLHSVFAALMLLSMVLSPLAEYRHALLMNAGGAEQNAAVSEAVQNADDNLPPCHQAEESTAEEEQASSSMPCCPDQDCSPDKCMMHYSVASISIDLALHSSPEHTQIFVAPRLIFYTKPIEERLRPPIA
jgi:hypothetical protein